MSDRDAFLTTRRLAHARGNPRRRLGRAGLHAALQVAAEVDDPEAMIVVILPDGGRSYLSKIYSDAWMRQYGFLERDSKLLVGDVLARKRDAGEIPSLVTVQTHYRVRDAVALLHEHRVSQLPVVSAHDPATVVGAIGERGLLKHAADDPRLLDAEIVEVMEPPFPAVSADDPVRDAVELLVGDQQALLVTARRPRRGTRHAHRLAGSIGFVSDFDRPGDAFATRAVHAGLTPDPAFGSVIPAIHQTSTYAQRAPGEFVGDYDYARSANPTRAALEQALGELEGGLAVAFSSGLAAEHALITVLCAGRLARRDAGGSVRRHLPAGRQGAQPLGSAVRPGRPDGPRRRGARRDATTPG